ncbi:hypothetical protein M3Y97_00662100 [Aphelenchoides bicaudatus]|nr:hypothetical protein M3Y97_00662100 [Aphelenchoides bicaudatus]
MFRRSVTHQFNEYVLILNLSGFEPVLSKIIRAEQKIQEAATSPMIIKAEPLSVEQINGDFL